MATSTRASSIISNRRLTRSSSTNLKNLEYARVIAQYGRSREVAKLALEPPQHVQPVQISRTRSKRSSRHAPTAALSLRSGGSSVTKRGKVTKRTKKLKGPVYHGPGYSNKAVKAKGKWKGKKECSICAVAKELYHFPLTNHLKGCQHESNACRACIARHALTCLEKHGLWDKVACIECPNAIQEAGVCKLVWREDYENLVLVAKQKAEQRHVRFRWCQSPTCNAGQIHRSFTNPIVTCHQCGAMSCFNHRSKWHGGYSCQAYDDSHPEAESARTSEERVKSMAKKCPGKGCDHYVEKDGGCDSMFCDKCGTTWSWNRVKYQKARTNYTRTF